MVELTKVVTAQVLTWKVWYKHSTSNNIIATLVQYSIDFSMTQKWLSLAAQPVLSSLLLLLTPHNLLVYTDDKPWTIASFLL
jgi:hypothetical protein